MLGMSFTVQALDNFLLADSTNVKKFVSHKFSGMSKNFYTCSTVISKSCMQCLICKSGSPGTQTGCCSSSSSEVLSIFQNMQKSICIFISKSSLRDILWI